MSPPGAAIVASLAVLAACGSGPQPLDIEGKGLVTVDSVPPGDAATWARPDWAVGDRFVYERGGRLQIGVRVTEATAAGYVLEDERAGVQLQLDRDLGEHREHLPADPTRDRVRDPVDARLTWPLWIGKRWSCHYVQRTGDVGAFPILATYTCEAVEEITVPAGTFTALRIWRRARPAVEGDFPDVHELLWFAPDVGWFVRRLADGTLTELTEFDRQRLASDPDERPED